MDRAQANVPRSDLPIGLAPWTVDRTCHELRRPAAVIAGYCELLADGLAGELTAEQAEYVRCIERANQRLTRSLADLEMIALMSLEPAPAQMRDAGELLSTLVAERNAANEAACSRLVLSMDSMPALLVNEDALRTALTRLLDHAQRHARRGTPVEISVRARGATLCIDVADRGEPLSDEDVERAFEYLHRSERARGPDDPGGADLTVCRASLARVGGIVRAVRESKEQTTYRIELACKVGAQAVRGPLPGSWT